MYVNALDVVGGTGRTLALGSGAGVALTAGTNNVLVGQGAGAALSTGSGNTIVGGYTAAAETGLTGAVVLSDAGGGNVCARWDAGGNAIMRMNDIAAVPMPAQSGACTLGFRAADGVIVCNMQTPDASTYTSSAVSGIDTTNTVPDVLLRSEAVTSGQVALVGSHNAANFPRTKTLVGGTNASVTAVSGDAARVAPQMTGSCRCR